MEKTEIYSAHLRISMADHISLLIPAAGYSERMGYCKALLPFDGQSGFADHLLCCFDRCGCDPLIMVVNQFFKQEQIRHRTVRMVVNEAPEKGRSMSILLGIKQIPEGHACFIQNTDNPFVNSHLLQSLIRSLPDDGYVVPVYAGKSGHPVLLGRHLVSAFRHETGDWDFRTALQSFQRIEVPYEDRRILLNINTPGDYSAFMGEEKW